MAKTTVTHVTDDLDGSGDASEVSFAYQGVDYTIDLSAKNQASLEKALKPYLEAATKVSRRGNGRRANSAATGTTKSDGRDLGAVREWASANGIEVSERGRIKKEVLDQYDAAH